MDIIIQGRAVSVFLLLFHRWDADKLHEDYIMTKMKLSQYIMLKYVSTHFLPKSKLQGDCACPFHCQILEEVAPASQDCWVTNGNISF